jgi:hypothetical protein
MTTFNELIDEVLINLEGFTMRQDRTTYLTATIDDNDLSIALASGLVNRFLSNILLMISFIKSGTLSGRAFG